MTQKKHSADVSISAWKCPVVTVETIWHVPARGRRLAPSSSALRRSRSI